ncbi:hypothetical protein M3212_03725 [Alkalihalobacillus oceani]|uniref:CoA transferase subunit A n=1 Tax=Halalkalibacter oceani TaxID=1653776 RepID=UPI0020416C7B|nr:CoA transferase [Halalkalibacter oceani]MCM3759894.1 hypothetical protein [Halalkalibacter oceani]
MIQRAEKVWSMEKASALIHDGMRIGLGGFVLYQKPMAFVQELIRKRKRNLTLVGSAHALDADMLIGAGSLSKLETSYVGLEKFGLARNFRREMEQGGLKTVYFPELMAIDRFRADREGLDFWPVNSLGGNDVANNNPEIIPFKCPVSRRPLWAVPAAKIDVGIIHAHAADKYGNVQIQERHSLPQSTNTTIAFACKTLIVTVEKIVENREIRENPHLTVIPSYKTTCVVHVKNGSHPTSTLSASQMDDKFISEYVEASRTKESFKEFLDKYIYGTRNFNEYLNLVEKKQIESFKEGAE